MTLTMSARQSRALALLLLLLFATLVQAVLILPAYLLHRHYDFYLDQYSDAMARYQRIGATRPALEAKLAAVKARDPHKGFLKNASPALAASEVQDVTKNLIEANGGKLNAMTISQPHDDGRFRQVAVNVQMSSSVTALRKMLYALESAQPYLFVSNLNVRANIPYGFRPQPGPDPEILFVTMDVSGFAVVTP